jgi:transposase-like protein
MRKRRRAFTEKFKAEVALEAVRGMKTLAELATEYKIHPNQISKWKKHLVARAADLYLKGANENILSEEDMTAPLYEEIGRLKMDVKWLKKKL